MSVLGKIPTIEIILSRLSVDNLRNLEGILNGDFKEIEKSLINRNYLITENDKGIKPCHLTTENFSGSGILIYTDYSELGNNYSQSYFIKYGLNQKMSIYHLDLETNNVNEVNEYCDLEELRRIINDYVEIEHHEEANRVIPTEIYANDNSIQLAHDGSILTGQNPVNLKTINGQSILGQGDISTDNIYTVTLTQVSTGILKSNETFNSHLLVAFEVETSGVHYGADFMLHPYDNISVCLVAFRIILNGGYYDAYANLDEQGHIIINLGNNIPSSASFKCHIISFNH